MAKQQAAAQPHNDNATDTAPDTAPAPALPVDQWHGMGGEYVIENGVRRRVAGPPVGPEAPAAA